MIGCMIDKEVYLRTDTVRTDYEKLALAELEKASQSTDLKRRNGHLDQAAIFATLNETQQCAPKGSIVSIND